MKEFNYNQIIYDYAMSWLGTPIIWGGQDRRGVDCSGLVQIILQAMDLDPQHDQTAQGLYNIMVQQSTRVVRTQFGSVSFYGKNSAHIIHCGFCLNPSLMIHARGATHRMTTPTQGFSIGVQINAIKYRPDFVGSILVP